LVNNHLASRDYVVERAKASLDRGLTKQLINRTLEPYQWYTCIVTFTEGENFFELRCPSYKVKGWAEWHSWKDACNHFKEFKEDTPLLDRLKCNKAQGEIHISLLAEAMWDAMNESTPKQLESGEWHIPFGDKIDQTRIDYMLSDDAAGLHPEDACRFREEFGEQIMIKIATARCARISYLNFEGKDDYEADIKLYDRLLEEGHMSPFEHCARAMNEEEFRNHFNGKAVVTHTEPDYDDLINTDEIQGWSGNFRGFVQLRKEIE